MFPGAGAPAAGATMFGAQQPFQAAASAPAAPFALGGGGLGVGGTWPVATQPAAGGFFQSSAGAPLGGGLPLGGGMPLGGMFAPSAGASASAAPNPFGVRRLLNP